MAMINEQEARLDSLHHWAPAHACHSLHLLRLDRLHPLVSGNKWYKLKYHLEAARQAGRRTLLSFGGKFSNHLVATAVAAQHYGFRSIGLVRGHYEGNPLSETLQACQMAGMELLLLSKKEYAQAREDDTLAARFPDTWIIPEGGWSEAGIRGASEIATLVPKGTTDVCVAVGTGTTFLGLRRGLPASVRLHGFYVARDFERGQALRDSLPEALQPLSMMHRVAEDRFGTWSPKAEAFIRSFFADTGIPLDVVYTSKMMQALEGLLGAGFFHPDAHIVCIHTGGLQGNPKGLFS